jgi:hypothetical protein
MRSDDVPNVTQAETDSSRIVGKPYLGITSHLPVIRFVDGGSRSIELPEWGKSGYCSFAYSAFACFRIGMSGSASFHKVKKS